MHVSQVRPPICHIVPVSRAYPQAPPPCKGSFSPLTAAPLATPLCQKTRETGTQCQNGIPTWKRCTFMERTPGLIQHVLTVLVFWSWVLLMPRLPPSSRSLRLCPWASILLHGPLDICLDLLPAAPLPPVQKRDAQHMFFYSTGGGHMPT